MPRFMSLNAHVAPGALGDALASHRLLDEDSTSEGLRQPREVCVQSQCHEGDTPENLLELFRILSIWRNRVQRDRGIAP